MREEFPRIHRYKVLNILVGTALRAAVEKPLFSSLLLLGRCKSIEHLYTIETLWLFRR